MRCELRRPIEGKEWLIGLLAYFEFFHVADFFNLAYGQIATLERVAESPRLARLSFYISHIYQD
jgi:hypothetical protein